MDIAYFGHSSFFIKGKHTSILTDPYDPGMVGIKFPKVSPEIVSVSHQHDDHNFVSAVEGSPKIVAGPGEYEINGVSIYAFASYHDNTKGAERGSNTIYLFEIDDFKVVHLGDLGHTLETSLVDKLGSVDVLFLPCGGVYTIGATEAVEVMQAIEPNLVIPMHYKTEAHAQSFSDMSSVDEFLGLANKSVEKVGKLKVGKESFSPEEDIKIAVLDIKG